jgi:acyl-CoA thioester hydrolase
VSVSDEMTGARVTVVRRLAWAETDAAGHNHFSVAVRWLEEAEHLLWRAVGFPSMVPRVPRVHVEVDYAERIWFDQEVEVTLGVIAVGRSSCTFGYEVRTAAGVVAQSGRHTVVHAPDPEGGSQPWPEPVRARLRTQAFLAV